MEELLQIENEAKKLSKETVEILEKNYPLDSRDFLTGEDAKIVSQNDARIKELAKRYLEVYKSLDQNDALNYRYDSLQGKYYQLTHKARGLVPANEHSDEYELHEAFSKATHFGMLALNNIYEAKKKNNQNVIDENKRVLDVCYQILSVHFWGEERIQHLERYETRLASGRTEQDDLADYKKLIDECHTLSVDYATAIINGISPEEKETILEKYYDIFEREQRLKEFMSRETIFSLNVNLHWMKLDAEKDPQKFLDEAEKESKNQER